MNKKLLVTILSVLVLTANVYASDVTRSHQFVDGEVLTAAQLNTAFDEAIQELNDIDGDQLASDIAIVTSAVCRFGNKVAFTQTDNNEYIDSLSDGYIDIEGTTGIRPRINGNVQIEILDGVLYSATDNDVDLGDAAHEFKDLYVDGTAKIDACECDTADIDAGTWQGTIDGNWTASGETCADLGTVTTADIDGGTYDGGTLGGSSQVTITDMDCNGGSMDGVNIGTTTATGELIVNNSSDDADGLGAQGTAGQYLRSAGTGSNPTFADLGVEFVSLTEEAAFTDDWSPVISITDGNEYYVVWRALAGGGDAVFGLRFNEDSDSHYAGTAGEGSTDSTSITLSGTTDQNKNAMGYFYIFTADVAANEDALVIGETIYFDTSVDIQRTEVLGAFDGASAVSSFELIASASASADVILYKLGEQ